MLQALSYAHSKGLVHRDVKPDNIVIREGQVKLTDFGLANLVSLLAEQKSAYIIGTPSYMPPEQILGEGIDGRADLYALGVTLFEMVTGGRRPFEYKDRREILMAHVEETPPSVKLFAPDTPLMLERVIMKLLAKEPDDRYPSAEVVLELFQAMQARRKFNQRHLKLLETEAKPLIGRAEELQVIETIWAKVLESNTPRLLIVTGDMGIGKSRLIAQFLGERVVDKGFTALAGHCDELGAPYTPFAEILATIFDRGLVKPKTIENQIDQIIDQIPGLAPLLNIELHIEKQPQPAPKSSSFTTGGLWKTLSDRVPENVADNPLKAQWQFFATVTNIIIELGPTVLFLDDAAFLDESSAALVRFLTRQVQLPLLIVAECTPRGKPVTWLDIFPAAHRDVIDLPPLSTTSIKAYLDNLLNGPVSEPAVQVIEKRSRGIPFYIEEVTRQFVDAGKIHQSEEGEWRYTPPNGEPDLLSQELVSPTLLNAFTRQLHRLPDESQDLLSLAALLEPGPDFQFDLWLDLLGGESKRAAAQAALEEALQRRLLRDLGDGHYTFRPANLDKTMAASIPQARRRELHQQIAKILINREDNPILIGYHYEQAGLAGESARYLELAGARAMATNAIHQAIDCYKRAVELVESQSAYVALGNLYRQQGAWTDSIAALQHALKLAKATGSDRQQAQILNDLSFTSWLSDQYQEAAKFASTVLKLPELTSIERATAQSHLGMISWLLGHYKEAEEWCQKAVELLENSEAESRLAGAYNRLGLVYFAKGGFAEAFKVTHLSLDIRRRLADHWGEAYCLVSLGQVFAEQGDFTQAHSHFKSAEQLFEKIGSNDGIMVVSAEQGRAWLYQGQTAEALPLISKAMTLAEEIGKRSAYGLGDIYLLVAQANLALAKIEQAQAAAESALKLVQPAGNRKYVAASQAVLAQIYEKQAMPAHARKLYQKAIDLFRQIGHPSGLLRAQLNYAHFLAGQGDSQTAAALERQVRSEAAKMGLFLR
jgi:tetratricopeptide (TPR) repeat protein